MAGRVPYPRHRTRIANLVDKEEQWLWPDVAADRGREQPLAEIAGVWPWGADEALPEWLELMRGATDQIDLFDATLLDVLGTDGVPELLAAKANLGVAVRLLVSDHDTSWTREASDYDGEHPADVEQQIDRAHQYLRGLGAQPGVEVAAFWCAHPHSMLRFDDHMLITLHFSAVAVKPEPVLYLRRQHDRGLFDRFADHFNTLFARGADPFYPDDIYQDVDDETEPPDVSPDAQPLPGDAGEADPGDDQPPGHPTPEPSPSPPSVSAVGRPETVPGRPAGPQPPARAATDGGAVTGDTHDKELMPREERDHLKQVLVSWGAAPRDVEDAITDAFFPHGLVAFEPADPASDADPGIAIGVDLDRDHQLAELFERRQTLTEREFIADWQADLRSPVQVITAPDEPEAIVILEAHITQPVKLSRRILLIATRQAQVLKLLTQPGTTIWLVPDHITQIDASTAGDIYDHALPIAITMLPVLAATQALAHTGHQP